MLIFCIYFFINLQKSLKKKLILFLLLLTIFIILKQLIIEKKVYIFPIYNFLILSYFYNKKIQEKNFIKLININLILYLIVTIISKYIFLLNYRILENRFELLDYRFIGLEGSPAGPDIFFLNIVLINFFRKGNKLFGVLGFILYIATGSLSPVIAFILSLFLLPLKRLAIMLIISLTPILTFLYANFIEIREILNKLTTYRIEIWGKFLSEFLKNNIFILFFGEKNKIDILISNGRSYTNPHSFYINLFLEGGIIVLILLFYIVNKFYQNKNENSKRIIILTQFLYCLTNYYSLSQTGNPITIYILYFYLLNENTIYKRKGKILKE